MRVLIADDDPLMRHVLESKVRQCGFETTVVSNGEAAWEALQKKPLPEILLLDWMMPGIEGTELCRKARETFPKHTFYIVMVSSKDEEKDMLRALMNAGVDAYLTKPLNMEELKKTLLKGAELLNSDPTKLNLNFGRPSKSKSA